MDCGSDCSNVSNLRFDLEYLSFLLSWRDRRDSWDDLIISLSTTVFPGDIILDIMHRLPVKSLARFLCVCKTWYFVVKGKAFCRMHLNHNKRVSILFQHFKLSKQPIPYVPLLHCPYPTDPKGPLYPMKYTPLVSSESQINIMHDIIHVKEPLLDNLMKQISTDFCIIGVINGLVCLSWGVRIAFWNPATNEIYPLPLQHILYPETNFTLGFGLDMRDKVNYKVVRIVHEAFGILSVDIYNYKMNTWNLSSYPQGNIKWCISELRCAVIFNGIPYWHAMKLVKDKPNPREFIVGFDTCDHTFKFIQLPKFDTNVSIWDLGVIGDSLVILTPRDNNVLEIFVLGDMQWKKTFSIQMLGIKVHKWVGCLSSGYVVAQSLSGEFFTHNVWTEDIRYLKIYGCLAKQYNFVYEYLESLVPPRFKDFLD